jgi:cob(I)alamin adenosyltransferase
MAKVYTKTGDKGETGLVSGTRISKGDVRIELYGEVDQLNSHLGVLVNLMKSDNNEQRELVIKIQSALFDLGSNLACEVDKRESYKLPQISDGIIKEMESSIDKMDKALPSLKNFILPGGTPSAAYGHICRTFTRKVERELVRFGGKYPGRYSGKHN